LKGTAPGKVKRPGGGDAPKTDDSVEGWGKSLLENISKE